MSDKSKHKAHRASELLFDDLLSPPLTQPRRFEAALAQRLLLDQLQLAARHLGHAQLRKLGLQLSLPLSLLPLESLLSRSQLRQLSFVFRLLCLQRGLVLLLLALQCIFAGLDCGHLCLGQCIRRGYRRRRRPR